MNWTEFIMDVLKFTIPAVLVVAAMYILLKKFFENEEKKRYYELRNNTHKSILPIRLQAYERLTLLLERLSVNNLILRVKKPGMSAADLMQALLAEIRAEFDHNLSQQIYVSHEAWQYVSNGKEGLVKLINISYSTLPQGASSMDLSKAIFENAMKEDYPATYKALLYIKKEAQELF
ncbi:MAG: DUF7935 family protein [Bacteroidia bacterium]